MVQQFRKGTASSSAKAKRTYLPTTARFAVKAIVLSRKASKWRFEVVQSDKGPKAGDVVIITEGASS